MEDLVAARLQMAISLGWHIIFACIGMAMPFFMAVAEWKWIKTKDEVYLDLAKSWSKGVAIFFAVGAVSGTVLSLSWAFSGLNSWSMQGPFLECRFH